MRKESLFSLNHIVYRKETLEKLGSGFSKSREGEKEEMGWEAAEGAKKSTMVSQHDDQ